MGAPLYYRDAFIRARAREGIIPSQLARELDCSVPGLIGYCSRHDIEIVRGRRAPPPHRTEPRNASILMRCLQGESYAAIAVEYGVTRERIRQIVDSAGASEAVKETKVERNAKARVDKHTKFAKRFGVTKERHKQLCDLGVTGRWTRLRANCQKRGIFFNLTLVEYAAVVGNLPLGRKKGEYIVAPRDRELGYRAGNLIVRSASSNARVTRARDEAQPRTAVATGVYLLMPGTPKPYAARISHKHLGFFATPEAAIAARAEALAEAA